MANSENKWKEFYQLMKLVIKLFQSLFQIRDINRFL